MPTQPQRESVPAPDPTSLTTEFVVREVGNLDERLHERLQSSDKAVQLLQKITTESPTTRELKIQAKCDRRCVRTIIKAERRRLNEQAKMRDIHAKEMAEAESKRIDAIRAVDVAAVSVASERATAQASVLANQVVVSADTLRNLVASTDAARATQLTQMLSALTDRIGILEKSQYENKGSGSGMERMWGWAFGILMFLVGIAGVVFAAFKH